MPWLFLLAVVAQTADAAVTCDRLSRGYREVNPLLGSSCPQVVAVKAASFAPLLVLSPRWDRRWLIGLAVGGGVGVGVTVAWGNR